MGFNLTVNRDDVSVNLHLSREEMKPDRMISARGYDAFVSVEFQLWNHEISPISLKSSTGYLSIEQAEFLHAKLTKAIAESHRLSKPEELKCEDCGAEEIQEIGGVSVCGNCRATESAI